ncbi:hypothetical protein D16iCDA_03345 [Pseudomonas seleniipraecipitans]|uniref:Uncharacterized protein n=1 Tax=Phytopseudomonas seleniipraecipitans TaxID=640205 RepID=A0ABY5JDJ1_9GAMM|nr:hypothetical protein [Pseudomonas seleniipraecipitans]UUD64748.1 hypothetical protein D16iCDA_03345 [Pseudomonas seleniipraecipitans]
MGYIPKYTELEALTDDELIARYDAAAVNTVVGTGFYREEIARRQMEKESTRMLQLTQTMRTLTWVILGLTTVNAILVAVQLWQS